MDILETLRRDEVSGRDQDRAENCSDSTCAVRSTDGPDDDPQQGPKQTDARPPSRQQRNRQVQCCRFRAGELEGECGKRA